MAYVILFIIKRKKGEKLEHIIIGTAGHIDHGKTAMIRALTGRDTDTLKEEKERKISIDLGFTYFDLPNGNRAGVIDVPGHEKFLQNMLAGVGGMDLVLLVIALDEGIMPQTREHMDILEKLHVPGGIVVLTKLDCVDEEWADMMEEEIRESLTGSIFETWPVQRISSTEGTGIKELKSCIVKVGGEIKRTRDTKGSFRMPVDRVMSLKGLGTVIAGTVMEGRVCRDEKIMLYPSGREAKIKSIQIHGQDKEQVCAGQRAAFLLNGVSKEEVKRGFVAAAADSLQMTGFLDVKIEMFDEISHILKNRARVHLHIGTSQVLCRVVLLNQQELRAQESGYAQLVLEEQLAVKKKDRFIIRFYSPLETIGGGIVLDEKPQKHKRFDEQVLSCLKNREENREEEMLLSFLDRESPVSFEELRDNLWMEQKQIEILLKEGESQQTVAILFGKKEDYYWTLERAEKEMVRIRESLKKHHQTWLFQKGMKKSILKDVGWKSWKPACFDAWLEYLEAGGQIIRKKTLVSLPEFVVKANEQSERIKKMLTEAMEKAKFDFIHVNELCPGEMDKRMYADILEFLKENGDIVFIVEDCYTTPGLAQEMEKMVKEYFKENEILTISVLRDLLQSNRRSAKAAFIYLDRREITEKQKKETERVYKG